MSTLPTEDLEDRREHVGRRRECLLVDGALVDELYMAKLLIKGAATSRTEHGEPIAAPS